MIRSAARILTLAIVFSWGVAAQAQLRDTAPAVEWPRSAQGWSDAATRDINAAYTALRDNHPGMVDPDSTAVPQLLDEARATGLRLAARVTSAIGYASALAAFSNTLQDGHAGARATLTDAILPARQWPGFVAAWRGNRLLVQQSADPRIARGAEILSCDGRALPDLIRDNVFQFQGRPREAGNWWVLARNLFIDDGNPFITRPAECRFGIDGRTESVGLHWQPSAGTPMSQWLAAGYNGVVLPIGLSQPAEGMAWIAMPDFDPGDAGVQAYAALDTRLREDRAAILNGRAVVLDLRGNEGGSSLWSLRIAERLWGADAVNTRMQAYSAQSRVFWRPTAGNEAHVRRFVPRLRELGHAAYADEWARLAERMAAARAEGRPLLSEEEARVSAAPTTIAPTDLTVPVYVIVPGQCGSACLNALDVFTRFPNTRLIGAPSSADTPFMEVRSETLPSGFASVTIPNKMYVSRPRAAGEVYTPAIEVTDLDWTTEAFVAVIETDLARRGQP